MRTAGRLPLAAVVVIIALILMSRPSEAVQDSSLQETLDRAVDYLVNNYNATMGLIPEAPNGTTYWLYSDNFLASYVLGNYDPNNATLTSLPTNISNTISRYMLSFPDTLNRACESFPEPSRNRMEQAFPEIVHPFSRKEAQFFENCSRSVKCHNNSKSTIVHIGILGIPEKSELLLIVTAKMLQKHGLSNQVS